MKQLILIRHAKSDWGDPGLDDHERLLNARGHRNAPEMGARLRQLEVLPDGMFTSTAVRAQTTAKVIAEALDFPVGDIVEMVELYLAGVNTWLDFIVGLEDGLDRVMCFGHNPGLTELVHYEFECELDNVPTCGVVTLDFDVEHWAAVPGSRPVAFDFDYPKKKPRNTP